MQGEVTLDTRDFWPATLQVFAFPSPYQTSWLSLTCMDCSTNCSMDCSINYSLRRSHGDHIVIFHHSLTSHCQLGLVIYFWLPVMWAHHWSLDVCKGGRPDILGLARYSTLDVDIILCTQIFQTYKTSQAVTLPLQFIEESPPCCECFATENLNILKMYLILTTEELFESFSPRKASCFYLFFIFSLSFSPCINY